MIVAVKTIVTVLGVLCLMGIIVITVSLLFVLITDRLSSPKSGGFSDDNMITDEYDSDFSEFNRAEEKDAIKWGDIRP
jgi:hypothetical protein